MSRDRAAKAGTTATTPKSDAGPRLPRGTKQVQAVGREPDHAQAWRAIRERGAEISARLDALLTRLS